MIAEGAAELRLTTGGSEIKRTDDAVGMAEHVDLPDRREVRFEVLIHQSSGLVHAERASRHIRIFQISDENRTIRLPPRIPRASSD